MSDVKLLEDKIAHLETEGSNLKQELDMQLNKNPTFCALKKVTSELRAAKKSLAYLYSLSDEG